jgi:uncharacterized protein YdcH (DUF465 family)
MGRSTKRYRLLKPVFYLLFFSLMGVVSCDKPSSDEVVLLELFQKEKELNCSLTLMKDSISMEWDNINTLLKNTLPSNMPSQERANMLKVRNANLIRMFQSFDDVDETVKVALSKTEQIDQEMTKRITSLKKEANQIESQKIALFEKINQTSGAEEVARMKEVNKALLSQECQ